MDRGGILAACVLLLCALVSGRAGARSRRSRAPTASMTRRARVELNPVVYAFDAMAPIISLGQVSRWEPDPGYGRRVLWRRTGGLLRWYYWLHIGAGWMLTTLLVIAMTGVLREV